MEIGDAFVVNKADREGADRTVAELQAWLEHGEGVAWEQPVLKTVAATGQGIDEVMAAARRHREHILKAGLLERKRLEQARLEVLDVLHERALAWATRERGAALDALVADVAARRLDPYGAVERLLPDGWL